jgi:hypothetical protein
MIKNTVPTSGFRTTEILNGVSPAPLVLEVVVLCLGLKNKRSEEAGYISCKERLGLDQPLLETREQDTREQDTRTGREDNHH